MTILDRTFCASPNCKNECGRQMTCEEKNYLIELTLKGVASSSLVSQAYFCGKQEDEINKGLSDFAKKLESSQKDLPHEFEKILNDNFWELLA